VIFFFASAGASSAYLTVSEIFPMETRALCIAFFYAVGTGLGGAVGPLLFGALINTKHVTPVFWGYVLAAGLMVASGVVAAFLAVDAEGKQLEDIATPITAADAEKGAEAEREPAAAVPAHAGRPGFGRGSSHGWAPSASYSTTIDDDLRDEVAAIERTLREHGTLRREELKRRANTRYWGPGCFGKALNQALDAGIVTRVGRGAFALARDGGNGSSVPFVTGQEEVSQHR
jgi:sugar transport protein